LPHSIDAQYSNKRPPSLKDLWHPVERIDDTVPPLEARGHRPLKLTFEHQLKSLVCFHLEEHDSARHLLQFLEEDEYAREFIAPPDGIKRSSYCEAINTRGLEQIIYVYEKLKEQATQTLPLEHPELGDLVAIDGSLIDAVMSMTWADYRKGAKKAKVHLGFNINQSIPTKIFFTDGKGDERPFVSRILSPGQTGVMDRYYQCHKNFDQWQEDEKHFVCRIKANTRKTIIESRDLPADSMVFFDAIVLLGTPSVNQTKKELRLVGYRIGHAAYWVATDRSDLSAEQIALIYKLRWEIEKFFGWWKQHLRVYHLIARSQYGFMVQMIAGLITYLLLSIYCQKHYRERVSIKRVRELLIKIQNEARGLDYNEIDIHEQLTHLYAKT
jgi:hypothetical protein